MSDGKRVYADKTFYQKSGEKSYLVICSGEEPKLPYQINMIRYNKISGLLPVQFFIEDGEYKYFYDISFKESLADRMKNKKYSLREIRTVMSDLYRCVQQMEDYLLDPAFLILEPEYIFSEKDNLKILFCFYQDKKESFEKSLEGLFDYFLNRLDYQDEKTVVFVYSLYQKSREERVPLSELMKQFCDMQNLSSTEETCRLKKEIPHEFKEDQDIDRGKRKEYEEESEDEPKFWEDDRESIPGKMGFHQKLQDQVQALRSTQKWKRWIPYVPDLVGGYMIARILWYISKNHAVMQGKTFMLWMFAVAGILAGCGVLSVFLSSISEKCFNGVQNKEKGVTDRMETVKKEHSAIDMDKRKESQKKHCQERRKEECLQKHMEEERLQKHMEKEQLQKHIEEEWWKDGRQKEQKKIDEYNEMRTAVKGIIHNYETEKKDGFEEVRFLEESDEMNSSKQCNMHSNNRELYFEKSNVQRADSVPATVVMSEAQIFKAFNPVLISKNKEKYQDIMLKERDIIVGKVRGIADICLEGKTISRVHAQVSQDKKGCSIMDMGSTNGTFINGVRLAERQRKYLEDGDEICFAEAIYTFQSAERKIERQFEDKNTRSQSMPDVI